MSEKFSRKVERGVGKALGTDRIADAINDEIDRRADEKAEIEVVQRTDGVISKPEDKSPDNPDYIPDSESPATRAGTSSPAETEASGQLSSGDPGFPESK